MHVPTIPWWAHFASVFSQKSDIVAMKSCCCYIQSPFTVSKYFDGFHWDVFGNIIFFSDLLRRIGKRDCIIKLPKIYQELWEVKILCEVGQTISLTVHFKYINGWYSDKLLYMVMCGKTSVFGYLIHLFISIRCTFLTLWYTLVTLLEECTLYGTFFFSHSAGHWPVDDVIQGLPLSKHKR